KRKVKCVPKRSWKSFPERLTSSKRLVTSPGSQNWQLTGFCATAVRRIQPDNQREQNRHRCRARNKQGRLTIMLLKEIMTTDVEVIEPETSITNAAKKMRSLDVGALPVCDGRRLLGMVTDRDITIRATAEARNPD